MPVLRSLRMLGSVEAGITTGAQLELLLADAGRKSELSVLLSSRGYSRRIANSTVTMAAVTTSAEAIKLVFKSATTLTNAACTAVVSSPIAMSSVSLSAATLNVVAANPTSWGLYSKSIYYETHVRTTIANLAGLDPATYPSVASMIDDPVAMASIASSDYAMSAVTESPATVALLVANASSIGLVAADVSAITIIAKATAIMPIIANSALAMIEINSRSIAVNVMANNVGAVVAISKSATAWALFQAGQYFAANLPAVVANLIGVSTTTYPTIASIIDDAAALALVSVSTTATTAMASNSAAMTYLANSPNLGVMLASPTAMAVLGPNTTAMTSFLGVSGAWSHLFSSSVAKGYIIASDALVDTIAANSALKAYLFTMSVVAPATGIPDGNATAMQPYNASPPLPSKVLVLQAKEAGIAATFSNYNFGGSLMTGSQAGATLALTAAGGPQVAHVAGYGNMTWNLQAIGVTAATMPIITYVSMV
jgi:hypothetical protein